MSDGHAPSGTTFYLNNGVAADVKKFSDAKLFYAHTGMVFTFCDVKVEVLFSADDLYIAEPYEGYGTTLIDFNNSSLVTRVYNDDASMLLLGDAGDTAAYRMLMYYGNYLKSDMVQISHHGVEDFPLSVYNYIKASILFYPCDQYLYDLTNRDNDVRKALAQSQYTKEILLHDKQRHTRYFADIAAAQ